MSNYFQNFLSPLKELKRFFYDPVTVDKDAPKLDTDVPSKKFSADGQVEDWKIPAIPLPTTLVESYPRKFIEVVPSYDATDIKKMAERAIYMYNANSSIPPYIPHIIKGEYEKAMKSLLLLNPMPGSSGRLNSKIYHGIGKTSNHEHNDIAIFQKFLSDMFIESGYNSLMKMEPARNIASIKIVGSGPSGLSTAFFLAKQGIASEILEGLPIPGGMLSFGIPEYLLPSRVVSSEIEFIKSLGVDITTKVKVGTNRDLNKIISESKIVVLGVGLQNSDKLDSYPTEEFPEIVDALPFLKKMKYRISRNAPTDVEYLGGSVVVIGDNPIALATARTAVRMGSTVTLLVKKNSSFPSDEKQDLAILLKEGIKIVENVENIDFIRDGRHPTIVVNGKNKMLAEKIVVAKERRPNWNFLNSLDIDSRPALTQDGKKIKVDPTTFATNIPNLFAVGDIVNDQSSFYKAIQDGKTVADAIVKSLKESGLI